MACLLPLSSEGPERMQFFIYSKQKRRMNRTFTRCFLLLGLAIFSQLSLLAQSRKITGFVLNQETHEPLVGVTIGIKGSTTNTITDEKGQYTITVPSNETVLKISYIGFAYQESVVGSRSAITFNLSKDSKQLEDVVVSVGYGSQKRSNVLGAVSVFNPKEVEDLPVANLSTALKNVVPGVAVAQTSGKPGATTNLTIRGSTTFSSGGTSGPLYVIDGLVETYTTSGGVDATGKTSFDNLDPTQIESITFLKDASATIYGARGANGVVLVTTKRGKAGKPKLTYSGSYSTEAASKIPDMISGYDQALLLNNWVTAYKPGAVVGTEVYSPAELDYIKAHNYNWFDQTWHSAHVQRHTVNVSGGTDRLTYSAGANYYDESGNLNDLYAKKYGLRLGMTAKIVNGLTADIVVGTDNSNLNRPSPKGTSAAEQSDQFNVTVGTLLHVPGWVPMYAGGSPVFYSPINWHPQQLQNSGTYANAKSTGLTINASLEYKVPVIEGLTFKVQYGRNTRSGFGKEYYASYNLNDYKIQGTHTNITSGTNKATGTQNVMYTDTVNLVRAIKNGNSLSENVDFSLNQQLDELITYARVFGKHSISATLGAEQIQTTGDNIRTTKELQVIPGVDQYFGFSNDNTANNITVVGQSSSAGRVSYFGRLNYSFMDRYLLEGAFRRDASPNFPTASQWGNFASGAIGWKISEENFFRDNIRFINDLKFRFNVGLTGNDATSAFAYVTRYSSGNGMLFGSSLSNALNNNNIPNNHITWEKALYKDAGIDGSFWNRKFVFSIDYYYRHQYDMLETPNSTVPNTFGGTISDQNHGILNSWGFDGSIGYNGNIGKDFSYFINMNFSRTQNKVIRKYYNAGTDTGWKYPIGVPSDLGIGGYVATGVVRSQAEVDAWYAKHPGWTINSDSLRAGDMNFQDINGDGKITDVDQTRLKRRANALFGTGFNLGVSWKGVRLSANIGASWGGYTTWRKADVAPPTKDASSLVMWKDSWTVANPNGSLPAIYAPLAAEASSYWIHDATSMRVNNMQLSYSLPPAFVTRNHLPQARFYITGFNLWTLINPTPYKDPAANTASDYPILRTYTFGVNLSL